MIHVQLSPVQNDINFGLLIMGFENAVKEGDEQRLFET